MEESEHEGKLLAAAIAAVLAEASKGEVLLPSSQRRGGSAWSKNHRLMVIGRCSLFPARTRRSATR
jgi:hypothetical protein